MKRIAISILIFITCAISSLGGEYKAWNHVDDKIVIESEQRFPKGSRWAYRESREIAECIQDLNNLAENGATIHYVNIVVTRTQLFTLIVCYSL